MRHARPSGATSTDLSSPSTFHDPERLVKVRAAISTRNRTTAGASVCRYRAPPVQRDSRTRAGTGSIGTVSRARPPKNAGTISIRIRAPSATTTASSRPSADQRWLIGRPAISVTGLASAPSTGCTYSCGVPPRFEMNDTHCPSGETRLSISSPAQSTNGRVRRTSSTGDGRSSHQPATAADAVSADREGRERPAPAPLLSVRFAGRRQPAAGAGQRLGQACQRADDLAGGFGPFGRHLLEAALDERHEIRRRVRREAVQRARRRSSADAGRSRRAWRRQTGACRRAPRTGSRRVRRDRRGP